MTVGPCICVCCIKPKRGANKCRPSTSVVAFCIQAASLGLYGCVLTFALCFQVCLISFAVRPGWHQATICSVHNSGQLANQVSLHCAALYNRARVGENGGVAIHVVLENGSAICQR
jgi:hypothetical protein